jgi:hypothetical protein
MELPTILDPIIRHLIETVREYVEEVRHAHVDFTLKYNDNGTVTAKFSYGLADTGSLIQAICGAIANVLEPIQHQNTIALKG